MLQLFRDLLRRESVNFQLRLNSRRLLLGGLVLWWLFGGFLPGGYFVCLLFTTPIIVAVCRRRQGPQPTVTGRLLSSLTAKQAFFYLLVSGWLILLAKVLSAYLTPIESEFTLSIPLEWLLYGPVIYFGCFMSVLAVSTMVRLNENKHSQKAGDDFRKLKKACSSSNSIFSLFLIAFFVSILTIVSAQSGPATTVIDWLSDSANQAHLSSNYGVLSSKFLLPEVMVSVHERIPVTDSLAFEWLARATIFLLASTVLLTPAIRLAAFLTSVSNRCRGLFERSLIDSITEVISLKCTRLTVIENRSWMKNAALTACWLLACYFSLFWLIAYCPGALGATITNWLDCCIRDANLKNQYLRQLPNLRLFIASIVALYGTVPLAVSACVFLPYAKPKQVVLNSDGILFSRGPFLSLVLKPYRIWADVVAIDYQTVSEDLNHPGNLLVLNFRSGGSFKLRRKELSDVDLDELLSAIDEYAPKCAVSDQVLALRKSLKQEQDIRVDTEKMDFRGLREDSHQATIFAPHSVGDKLPGDAGRVVRLLSSKPLAAVYAVRSNEGSLVVVKQFFIADDTRETLRLRRAFLREYETIKILDHRGIAKVLDVFENEHSTYLVLEHRGCNDLRGIVVDQGPRSQKTVLDWGIQLCDIISYLHSRPTPILHRDITPDNLVVDHNGMLSLIDFGAAHQFLEGITGTMIGKQCYVAPEQLRGLAEPASDIYSIGCTLFFLLTGKDPIPLTKSDPSRHATISKALVKLIEDCTEFETENRPTSIDELKLRLKFLTHEREADSFLARTLLLVSGESSAEQKTTSPAIAHRESRPIPSQSSIIDLTSGNSEEMVEYELHPSHVANRMDSIDSKGHEK